MPEETFNIYDMLDKMREKPAMYLGVKSLRFLQAHNDGHRFALYERGLKDTSCPPFYSGEFNTWIEKWLGYPEGNTGWCTLILAAALGWSPSGQRWRHWGKVAEEVKPADDAAAFDFFYELLDEYRREYAEQKAG